MGAEVTDPATTRSLAQPAGLPVPQPVRDRCPPGCPKCAAEYLDAAAERDACECDCPPGPHQYPCPAAYWPPGWGEREADG